MVIGGISLEREMNLKKQLLEIRDNDWTIPEGTDVYQLALDAMDNIGSTDGELRDHLILAMLYRMITEKMLTNDQIREILEISLSEDHLFKGVGYIEDDSVFNRAFTILIIRWIIYYHNHFGENLFSKDEMDKVFGDVIRYVQSEKDIRGYVKGKGWAHAIAHSADALASLSQCNYIGKEGLIKILDVVKEKSCVTSFIYAHQEHERLVAVVTSVMKRKVLSDKEILNWIKSFENLEGSQRTPDRIYFKENVKNLLRSLYFRLKFIKAPDIYFVQIEEVLNKIDGIYNKLENMDYF